MERKGRDYHHRDGKAVTWRKRTPRRTPRKNVAAGAPREGFVDGGRFEFQKRMTRIDWCTLHTIDVDRVIREVGNVTQPLSINLSDQCSTAVVVFADLFGSI